MSEAPRLGIEVDGEAHDRGDRPQRDASRDAHLESMGFTMLRIPAREVLGNDRRRSPSVPRVEQAPGETEGQ